MQKCPVSTRQGASISDGISLEASKCSGGVRTHGSETESSRCIAGIHYQNDTKSNSRDFMFCWGRRYETIYWSKILLFFPVTHEVRSSFRTYRDMNHFPFDRKLGVMTPGSDRRRGT